MQANNFGGSFDQLFLWIFSWNFHRRCLSTFSRPWCKKVINDQKLKSRGGSCLKDRVIFPVGKSITLLPQNNLKRQSIPLIMQLLITRRSDTVKNAYSWNVWWDVAPIVSGETGHHGLQVDLMYSGATRMVWGMHEVRNMGSISGLWKKQRSFPLSPGGSIHSNHCRAWPHDGCSRSQLRWFRVPSLRSTFGWSKTPADHREVTVPRPGRRPSKLRSRVVNVDACEESSRHRSVNEFPAVSFHRKHSQLEPACISASL